MMITDLLKFFIGIMVLVILNQLTAQFPVRWDLTEEKRFSIQPATRDLLTNLDEVVYIDVYLDGELPAGFERLKKAIRETLEEFRVYAGDNIQYKFVNPNQAVSQSSRNQFYASLAEKGIQPSNVIDTKDGQRSEKLVFPGALVARGTEETGVLLLKGNKGAGPDQQLNQSIEGLEYELAAAIRGLSTTDRRRIGMVRGHGELADQDLADLTNSLASQYDIGNVNLAIFQNLIGYDALIVVKPVHPFSELEKYNLDQFIMQGGKALFFMDVLHLDMDSIKGEGTYALPVETNLDDMFFKYGVRINKDLVVDRFGQRYPIVVGTVGNQPNLQWMPWPFYPLINHTGDHPIVKNLDVLSTRFVSSMDTVKAEGVIKTPLFFSSEYSMKADYPVKVSLNDLRKDFNPETFNQGPIPLAYLLEGNMTSLFKNRLLPESAVGETPLEEGRSKIIVVADGDMMTSQLNPKTERPLPMGFDLASQQEAFANRDFLMNSMAYLLNDQGIINARNKEIKIRPLDTVRISDQRLSWQLFNLLTPLVLLIVYGVGRSYIRKRKYGNFK
ncbi:MAG: gliding motility-associated ABC transporter substrate-binding protein GldG [Cyclobacteriaceae bacterium]|nr:MAG: gliding motility-associated ABC transporter substrate-binding protein GldG [Cyclobacteriaceae bacterium]